MAENPEALEVSKTPLRKKILLDETPEIDEVFKTAQNSPFKQACMIAESPQKLPLKTVARIAKSPQKSPFKHENVEIMISTPNGSSSHLWATKFFNAVRAKQFDLASSENQALTDENIELKGRLNDALILVEEYKVKLGLLEEKLAHAFVVIAELQKSSMKKPRRSAASRRRSTLLVLKTSDDNEEAPENEDDLERPSGHSVKKTKKKRKSGVIRRKSAAADPNNNAVEKPTLAVIDEDSVKTSTLAPNDIVVNGKAGAKIKRRSVQMKTKPLQRSKTVKPVGGGENTKSMRVLKLPDFSKIRLPEMRKRDLTHPDPFEVYHKPTRASLLRRETIKREMEAKKVNNS